MSYRCMSLLYCLAVLYSICEVINFWPVNFIENNHFLENNGACVCCKHNKQQKHTNRTSRSVVVISVLPENCPMGQNSADDICPRIKID